jgi:hypothetical protein
MWSDVVRCGQILSGGVRLCRILSDRVRCCQVLSGDVRWCQMLSDAVRCLSDSARLCQIHVRFCQVVPYRDTPLGPLCRTLARGPCAGPLTRALVQDPAVAATAAATAKQDCESQGTQPIFDMTLSSYRLLLLSASARKCALNRLGAGTRIHDVARQAPVLSTRNLGDDLSR